MSITETGIYEIRNLVNGKRYVGSAVRFSARWAKHLSMLRRNIHHSQHLQRSWNLDGEASFEFRRLVICGKEMLLTYEQAAMDALRPEYNVLPNAGSCLGVKRTTEFCKALGDRKRGQKHSEETKRVIAEKIKALGGRPHTDESRRNMSAAQKGRKTEHLSKLAAMKVGVSRSEQVRTKIGQAVARLSDAQVREIRARHAAGELQRQIALGFGVGQPAVSEIVRGVSYAWVT